MQLMLCKAHRCSLLASRWRALSTVSTGRRSEENQPTMAIRRETINVWERRAPLAPQHVRQLVKKGVKVIVQPSDRRAYSMQVRLFELISSLLSSKLFGPVLFTHYKMG